MKINIVIPVYNEEDLISATLSRIDSEVKSPFRAIIIDDGSSDGTADSVGKFLSSHPGSFSFFSQPHQGFAAAIKKGLSLVPGDQAFVTVMADGCDDLRQIDEMHNIIEEGKADMVCACRYIHGGQIRSTRYLKSFASLAGNRLFSLVTGGRCHDMTNSFKMYKKNIFNSIVLESAGFDISLEMAWKAYKEGFRIQEIPTTWKERVKGKSKFAIPANGPGYLSWLLKAILCRLK